MAFLVFVLVDLLRIVATQSAAMQLATTQPAATRPVSSPPPVAAIKAAAGYSRAHRGFALLVTIDGKIAFEQYDGDGAPDRADGLASGSKSFAGAAAVAAVQDGFIRLDDPVAGSIPEWNADPLKASLTYRHLLNMTSGITRAPARPNGAMASWKEQAAMPLAHKPGERFDYGGHQINVFAYALERKLRGGETYEQYLNRRILDPIGATVEWRERCEDGHPRAGGGGAMTARAWAAFGELLRRDGTFNGNPLLDPTLLRECFRGSRANPAYGLAWWLKSPVAEELRRAIPMLDERWADVANSTLIPDDLITALGGGGQRLYVIPSLKLVVVRQGGKSDEEFNDLQFLRLLLGRS
jgi:CubicO group peptidase (beta-lactamase class C family)